MKPTIGKNILEMKPEEFELWLQTRRQMRTVRIKMKARKKTLKSFSSQWNITEEIIIQAARNLNLIGGTDEPKK